jgi:lantibiotic modifying enzyme
VGNLDLLLQATRTLGPGDWADPLAERTAQVLNSGEAHGWVCGVPLGVETPGLLSGLAGIGYQLLRLATAGQVPAVLVLAPPAPRPPAGAALDPVAEVLL